MSNVRKLIYNQSTDKCAIRIGGKLHSFKPDMAFDASKTMPGHYGVKIESRNYFFPVSDTTGPNPYWTLQKNKISNEIPPLSFPRPKTDLQGWRDAIREAELKPFNWRVLMQTVFQDVYLDGHVKACWDKRKRMTLLKKPSYFKDGKPVKGYDFINTDWWYNLCDHILDAQGFGYTLVELGDKVNGGFPDLSVVPRQNISPDRLVVTPVVYMVSGIPFTDETYFDFSGTKDYTINYDGKDRDVLVTANNGEEYAKWCIWAPTPNVFGAHTSSCGYGLFYWVSLYAILVRQNLEFNATFNEKFIMPIPWLKTAKTDPKERQDVFNELLKMGASGAFLTDLNDVLQMLENKNIGTGYEAYDKFEMRMQKSISALLLGHQDAMHIIPGRASQQQSDEKSPVEKSMAEVEKEQDKWMGRIEKQYIRPKLQALGFSIPDDLTYGYLNEKEDNDWQERQNKNNVDFGKVLQLFSIAGYKVKKEYIEEITGIPVEEAEPIENNDPERLEDIAEPGRIKKNKTNAKKSSKKPV